MTAHSEDRPYICPYDHKGFKTVVACRKHIKIHRNEFIALLPRKDSDDDTNDYDTTNTDQIVIDVSQQNNNENFGARQNDEHVFEEDIINVIPFSQPGS
jgi:hypothetical protein